MIAPSSTFTASIEIDSTIHRIVGRKVERLVATGEVARQDAGDLEHDLYVRMLKALPAFDPALSHLYAFATTVTERGVATFLRDRRAEKRDPARVKQTEAEVAVDCDSFAKADLAIDVAAVIGELPADLRDLAERLKKSSISQVARDANVSRKVIYRQVRKLRERFEQAGLGQEGPHYVG